MKGKRKREKDERLPVTPLWDVFVGGSPVAAVAIHHGHAVRPEVSDLLAVPAETRLREEDPFTGSWTEIAETRIVVNVSRFEMDLNRPREKAVYLTPEDAWGLQVWKREPRQSVVAASLEQYDAFYQMARGIFSEMKEDFGRFVVLDLHTYNHRRDGPDGPAAPLDGNPEINVGTGTMDRSRWVPIVERFIRDTRGFDFPGSPLDVRENVKFRGGNLSRWIHESFPETGCCLAVEVKKFFMDEWTGELDRARFDAITAALRSTVPGILQELSRLKPGG